MHYRKLIEQAEKEGQGLLVSYPKFEEVIIEGAARPKYNPITKEITLEPGIVKKEMHPMFRDEHSYNTYYALPNFNINGAKHILPFDLRLPTQWNSRIVYRKQGGNI